MPASRNKDPVLSFEAFSKPKPRNNFHLFFCERDDRGVTGINYRRRAPWPLALAAEPEKLAQLWDEILKYKTYQEVRSGEYLEILYQAYLVLHEYAESDRDLFK